MQVKDLMKKNLEVCYVDDHIHEVCRRLVTSNLTCAVVLNRYGQVVGIFNGDNLTKAINVQGYSNLPISSVMTGVRTVQMYQYIEEVWNDGFTVVPVVDNDDKLIGVLHKLDILAALLKQENTYSGELIDVKNYQYIIETIVDNPYGGIMVVNDKCYITMMNQAYGEFLGIDPKTVIGRKVKEVIENTRMHIIVETGKPELLQVQRINNKDIICNRIPIKKNNKIIGAFCQMLFQDVSELKGLANSIEKLKSEVEYYKGELKKAQGTNYTIDSIIGQSPKIMEIKDLTLKAGRTNSTVLIRGESGTGKELFAHAIHNASQRAMGSFIKVNCAALPENLLESELFGYNEGAFTGAKKGGKLGKFELAQGGTIFLDEIGDMPLSMQVKILRVLQEREIEKIGSSKTISVDVRIVAATNQNLEELIKMGKFREDLFYRLNVVSLKIPPLRERRADIPALVEYLLIKLSRVLGCSKKKIDSEALYTLVNGHSWPGNIRELENIIERALNIIGDNDVLSRFHLPLELFTKDIKKNNNANQIIPLKQAIEETEYIQFKKALIITRGDCLKAANLLGIGKSTFYERMKKYNIKA